MAWAQSEITWSKGIVELLDPKNEQVANLFVSSCHAAGHRWYTQYLPPHFEESAPAKYNAAVPGAYRKLSKKYVKAKGHSRPMVNSGEMKNTILGGPLTYQNVRSNRILRVTIKPPRSPLLNLWQGGHRKHDFARTLLAMTSGEAKVLLQIIEDRITAGVAKIEARGGTVKRRFVA